MYIWIEIWSNVRLVLTLLAWQKKKKKACPGGRVHTRWELFFESKVCTLLFLGRFLFTSRTSKVINFERASI
jgi:hypothetical protein